jgi:hypothetical protein
MAMVKAAPRNDSALILRSRSLAISPRRALLRLNRPRPWMTTQATTSAVATANWASSTPPIA